MNSSPARSLSAQIILRGTRSAGYGFVALKTAAAAEKAASTLNKKELEGREVIVEIAKPAEQKDKERSEMDLQARVWGYDGALGMVQALAAGYFLYDLILSVLNPAVFGPGMIAHAVSALTVYSLGFVSLLLSWCVVRRASC